MDENDDINKFKKDSRWILNLFRSGVVPGLDMKSKEIRRVKDDGLLYLVYWVHGCAHT